MLLNPPLSHFQKNLIAKNKKEALHFLEEGYIDLILTDWLLPDGNGIEFLKNENACQTCPIVVMTSFGSEELAVEAMKLGAFDYIVKPFRMEELKVVVKNVRDKVALKKLNASLFNKLKGLYDEIERYRQKEENENTAPTKTSMTDTEHILAKIKKIEEIAKGRLFIG